MIVLRRHCEERKRRSNPVFKTLDCFASLAMTQKVRQPQNTLAFDCALECTAAIRRGDAPKEMRAGRDSMGKLWPLAALVMAGVAGVCEECEGKRFTAEVLGYRLRGRDISEVLAMPVSDALDFFTEKPVRAVPRRNACVKPANSTGSPRLVPVPCAST